METRKQAAQVIDRIRRFKTRAGRMAAALRVIGGDRPYSGWTCPAHAPPGERDCVARIAREELDRDGE